MNRIRRTIVLTTLLLLAACGSQEKRTESPFAPAPNPKDGPPKNRIVQKPWTDRFFTTGALVARDVRVEGPDGLLEHIVVHQDLSVMDISTKTTRDGLLQVVTLKPEVTGVELRAQLDNLALVALHSITILERPGPVDVVVSATGDVFMQEKGSGEELRGPTLKVVGKIAR